MPIDAGELVRAAEILAEQKSMRVALKYSLASGVVTGATTVVGGLLLGPIGLLIGSAVGGAASLAATHGKFKSVVSIIREDLNREQREALGNHLREALHDVGFTDVFDICTTVLEPGLIQATVGAAMCAFLKSNLGLSVKM